MHKICALDCAVYSASVNLIPLLYKVGESTLLFLDSEIDNNDLYFTILDIQ